MLAAPTTTIGSPNTGTKSTKNSAQAPTRLTLDGNSTAPSGSRNQEAVERIEPDRQRDVDDGDDATRRVVELLNRLAVDHHRQRDHPLRADEQHDAELVKREQQAQASAGKERRNGFGQDHFANDPQRPCAKARRDLDQRRV